MNCSLPLSKVTGIGPTTCFFTEIALNYRFFWRFYRQFRELINSGSIWYKESICYKVFKSMANWLRCCISSQGAPCSKPLGGSKVNSAFHLSEVGKMITRNIWELSGKNCFLEVALALRWLNPIHKKRP